MCGRAYQTYTDEELEIRYLNRKPFKFPWLQKNYNLAPTQLSPVVLMKEGERTIEPFRFGLVPNWADSVAAAAKYSLINAKSEEIDTKRSYARPFLTQRCIVPVSGFYEWKAGPARSPKQPFAIHLKNEPIISLAGIYEHWTDHKSGECVDSFSIVTTKTNSIMAFLHERMPCILRAGEEELWLDPELHDPVKLKSILRSYPSDEMVVYPVSSAVGSVKNNGPELLSPVDLSAPPDSEGEGAQGRLF
jgi:putative SOS response-associated peptidase YedK